MQRFWDSQFKFSEILTDFAGSLQAMETASDQVSQSHAFQRASYGPHPRQWVEWTVGEGPETLLPVILHGGYWRALEAETHRFMVPAFLRHGAGCANVEYRLMPEIRLADVVSDAVAGLRLLAEMFPKAEMVLVGHSAGAHLAVSALSDPGVAARTRGVIALSGVYDLAPVAQSFLQQELQLTPEEISGLSLGPDPARVPVLYVNGSAETHEFLRGSAAMATTANAGWRVLEGANHMSLTHAACAQCDTLLASLFELERPE